MKFADFSEELKFTYVAFQLEVLTSAEIVEWAGDVIERETVIDDKELVLLYGLGNHELHQVVGYLEAVCRRFIPEFKPNSPEASWFGHQVLRDLCTKYLNGEIDPDRLCAIVYPAEHNHNYPAWLGDLYGVCDRSDNEPRKKSTPDIYAEECRRILAFDSSHW